jgi:hypothetical protein
MTEKDEEGKVWFMQIRGKEIANSEIRNLPSIGPKFLLG